MLFKTGSEGGFISKDPIRPVIHQDKVSVIGVNGWDFLPFRWFFDFVDGGETTVPFLW